MILFFYSSKSAQSNIATKKPNNLVSGIFDIKSFGNLFNKNNAESDKSFSAFGDTPADIFSGFSTSTIDNAKKTLEQEAELQTNKTLKNFDKIIEEVDKEMINEINPLLKQIVVAPNKKDAQYINEVSGIITKSGNIKININDTKNMQTLGNYYKQQSIIFSKIRPSVNFQKFHLFWTASFGAKAYIFKKLSLETNQEIKYALLSILDNVVDPENKFINNLTK